MTMIFISLAVFAAIIGAYSLGHYQGFYDGIEANGKLERR